MASSQNTKVAAIFGVTGLVGKELARKLLSARDWKVYGIARHPDDTAGPAYHFVSCDLLSPPEAQQKLSPLEDVTHIFWVTWATQFSLDSPECYEQNKAMMANVLNVILPKARNLKHVSLQTGMKHYISFRDPSSGREADRYDEEYPRPVANNFYYALEDLLGERLPGYNVAWSIHRPGLIFGCSHRTLFNFIGSLCVYGAICKYLNLPFVFGGIKECWEEMYIDGSDARLVAGQHIWASTTITNNNNQAQGQAFNAINGVDFSWKEIWPTIGAKLGADEKGALFSADFTFSAAMGDKGEVWKEIVVREGLVESEMKDLANWDFLDVLFRCPIKMLGSRKKVDMMGFKTKYHVLDSIFYWIDVMRADKFIP
ncbi:3-oxo-delta(4 5)-steroid 5-beta-reductase [Phtheirospermum japonicum]|uniref:3-oxo-delta(4 5)-steroid 5-beta-reductase n=1 Tax=Phtheirospermum japonicum TaxID=374723 RepID=A0A830B7X1_9LAMI|nr:3-oxo-delta(4 5)-steroid 5-beta-reductase [Phtheirospermum japonicum]